MQVRARVSSLPSFERRLVTYYSVIEESPGKWAWGARGGWGGGGNVTTNKGISQKKRESRKVMRNDAKAMEPAVKRLHAYNECTKNSADALGRAEITGCGRLFREGYTAQ